MVVIKGSVCAEWLSRVWLFVSPWTVARQAPLSMGFSRQEHSSGMPFPPPGDLPNSEIKLMTFWPIREALWSLTLSCNNVIQVLEKSHMGLTYSDKGRNYSL